MKRLFRLMLAASLGAGLTVAAQEPSPAQALFQRGLLIERAEGNSAQAVVLFERVVADYPSDHVVVPAALFHLARLYKTTDPLRAALMWSRISTEFRQTRFAEEARRQVAVHQAQTLGAFSMRLLDFNCADCDVSPDGRSVAWIKEEIDGCSLLVRDLDTGRERTIVSERGLAIVGVDWSWDGQRLSFLSAKEDTAAEPAWEVRVVTPAGRLVRAFTIAAGMGSLGYAWTEDNQRIVVHVGAAAGKTQALQILDVATGTTQLLAGAEAPWAQSPDGRQIFVRVPSATAGDKFLVADVETGRTREVTIPLTVTGTKDRINIATSITKNRAWITRDEVLIRQPEPDAATFYLLSLTSGTVRKTCRGTDPVAQLAESRGCRQLTPDGRIQLAEDLARRRIMLLDLAAGTERRLTSGFGDEVSPILSPDGRLVAFLSNPDGKWAVFVAPLDKAPVAAPVRVTVLDEYPPAGLSPLAWSRDGRLVVQLEYRDEDVYRINMDKSGRPVGLAGRLTQDLTYSRSPSVSPESGRIAYRFQSGQKQGIAVMSADGAGERPVVQMVGPDHLEWLSADEVLFNKLADTGGPSAVTALNVNTGATRAFVDFADGFNWQYVPSRNEMVYVQGGLTAPSRTIRARSLSDGADRAIVTVEGMLTFGFTFRVSPDGHQIAYGRRTGPGGAKRAEMHLITIDGRDDRVLTTSPWGYADPSGFPYAWSPDGRFLLYSSAPGALMVVDVQTGVTWPVPGTTNGERHRWAGAQWAPDGSYIVVGRSGQRTEHRLFQGVTYDAVTGPVAAVRRGTR